MYRHRFVAILIMLSIASGLVGCGASLPPVKESDLAPDVLQRPTQEAEEEKPPPQEVSEAAPVQPEAEVTEGVPALARPFRLVDGVPHYVVGPGDMLRITLWKGFDSKSVDVPVRPDGKISYLFMEDIEASGRTAFEIDSDLTENLKRYFKEPHLDVIVSEYNSKQITLLGEVNPLPGVRFSGPNVYPLTGRVTLLELILKGGGQTDKGDLSRVKVRRGGREYTVNLVKALYEGDPTQDIVLEPNDVVTVPILPDLKEKRVLVFGEVNHTGVYSFKQETRVLDAISAAGGHTSEAVAEKVMVLRGDKGDLGHAQALPVNLRELILKADLSQNVLLQDGDVVFVPSSRMRQINDFIQRVSPVLSFILYPATYRDYYTTGGGLRIDTGLAPSGVTQILTVPTGGVPSAPR